MMLSDDPALEDSDDSVGFEAFTPSFPAAREDLVCGDCGAAMRLIPSSKFKTPFYGCVTYPACRGTHGANPDGAPLGTPVDKATRKARVDAHRVFDKLWQTPDDPAQKPLMSRSEAYTWLQKEMGLSQNAGHFAQFDRVQCEKVIELVRLHFPQFGTYWSKLLDLDIGD